MFYVQTSSSISPPHTPSSSKKEKIQEKNNFYLHSSPPLPHTQTKKMLSIHLYYILIPEQLTTKHVYLVVILIFTLIFQLEPHHLFIFFTSYFPEQLSLDCCFVSFRIASVVLFFLCCDFFFIPSSISFIYLYPFLHRR